VRSGDAAFVKGMIRFSTFAAAVCVLSAGVFTQEKRIKAADAWVKLPAPGESQTPAFANVENPTMYDIYIQAASADVAGKVELRDASLAGDAATKPLMFITVPPHDWAYMGPKGAHLLLMDLKRPLKEGETITLSLTTETGESLPVPAVVKRE